jgi:hypothetical protein
LWAIYSPTDGMSRLTITEEIATPPAQSADATDMPLMIDGGPAVRKRQLWFETCGQLSVPAARQSASKTAALKLTKSPLSQSP